MTIQAGASDDAETERLDTQLSVELSAVAHELRRLEHERADFFFARVMVYARAARIVVPGADRAAAKSFEDNIKEFDAKIRALNLRMADLIEALGFVGEPEQGVSKTNGLTDV
jgi:hypothetical protein